MATESKAMPPRHWGYRPHASGRWVSTIKDRRLPEPPKGNGGGSPRD